jgi:hypothetical protein
MASILQKSNRNTQIEKKEEEASKISKSSGREGLVCSSWIPYHILKIFDIYSGNVVWAPGHIPLHNTQSLFPLYSLYHEPP